LSVPQFKVSGVNELASPVDATTVRHQVMTAAAMAAQALTDTEQPPDGRLQTLIDAHGRILAARGPASPLTFSAFRDLLTQDLALLLPDGVPAEEMQGVHLITPDGQYDDDLYDLQQEQRLVLRALAKTTRGGWPASGELLEAEMDQERVYAALKKRQDEAAYVDGRKALIETPAGPDSKLRKLRLPSSVADFYRPITHAATLDRWWFACPICRWPMKITVRRFRGSKTGSARCFHRPHTALGAAYHFKIPGGGQPPSLVPSASAPPRPSGDGSVLFTDVRGHIPEPSLVEGHKALARGVWRWTTIPGLVEVGLYQALEDRGLKPVLWPDLDSYDLYVKAGTSPFCIDLKDYSNPLLLARKVQADEGDAGGAQWLVVPDYRAPSVPLLSTVCKEFGLNVATAGQIGALVCQKASVPWA
jgi:REase associating with pPIWI_RE